MNKVMELLTQVNNPNTVAIIHHLREDILCDLNQKKEFNIYTIDMHECVVTLCHLINILDKVVVNLIVHHTDNSDFSLFRFANGQINSYPVFIEQHKILLSEVTFVLPPNYFILLGNDPKNNSLIANNVGLLGPETNICRITIDNCISIDMTAAKNYNPISVN